MLPALRVNDATRVEARLFPCNAGGSRYWVYASNRASKARTYYQIQCSGNVLSYQLQKTGGPGTW